MSLLRPDDYEKWLARRARELASGFNPLFHGPRYLDCVLRDGYLKNVGAGWISFSRSADAAAYWAMMERDDDGGRGAILVFDRDRLRTRYRLELIDDSGYIAEQEEFVSARVVSLAVALVGVVSEPFPTRPREERHDVWHRRVHGFGMLAWKGPSKRVSLHLDNMPRADLRRLTNKIRRSMKRAQKRAANPISDPA
jgi:hypothetical protein